VRPGRSLPALLLAAALALAALALPSAASAESGTIEGRVLGGGSPRGSFEVELLQTRSGLARPKLLGTARTRAGGHFRLAFAGSAPNAVRYLVATRDEHGPADPYRLAAAIGTGPVPVPIVLNDRTTVAMAFAMAQFLDRGVVAGRGVGLANSAAMAADLALPTNGLLSPVLLKGPNGNQTSTRSAFTSLTNLSAACRSVGGECSTLLRLARPPGAPAPRDNLQALVDIARNPWHSVGGLFKLSTRVPRVYGKGLAAKPSAWTLMLRFEGTPETMDGPGNFAIDAGGNVWVLNNYEYSRNPPSPVCGSEQLLRFTPTGAPYPGSPYEGGGLSGAGFGISFDPRGRLWVGNFGFAGKGCTVKPPHNSVSLFNQNGRALSPEEGFLDGPISWAQGLVSDRQSNVWIASCGNDSAVLYPKGVPGKARSFAAGLGFQKPFGVAVGTNGQPFFTSNGNSKVVALATDGTPLPASPISGGGINRPLGVAVDSGGNMWVANSGVIIAPCSGEQTKQNGPETGSVTLIHPDGKIAANQPITNGGLKTPWGIAVDGDDHVWVANFGGKRVAELCGIRASTCPPGRRAPGAAISPAKTGYGFDGLVRSTGVAIDPSGNVWLTNNWKSAPVQSNPGGYQIVAVLGVAAPVKTPLIGPPQRP
jgi:sugar lactone lactonase YvrE